MKDKVASLCLGLLLVASASALDLPKDPEVGVYLSDGTDWVESPVEVVNWKTGGVVKSVLTLGVVREDVDGMIPGGDGGAAFPNTAGVEALIHTMEGTSAEEYQLIRLRRHPQAREFRSVTGGVFHKSGGAERDSISFTAIKIAPRLWRINLGSIPPGEYGFVPPADSKNLANSGKIYTFTIGECLGCRTSRLRSLAVKHRFTKNPALDF